MTARVWQGTAVAALAIAVLGGFLPLWPDGVRLAAFGVAAVLTVAAVVLRRRWRREAGERAREVAPQWGGAHDGPQREAPGTNPDHAPRPDHRMTGYLGG